MKTLSKTLLSLFMAFSITAAIAQPPRGERPSSPEDMAKKMTEMVTKELNLSETQQEKVYELELKSLKERRPMRNRDDKETPSQQDRENMRAQMAKKMEERQAEMKTILTDEQYQKWTEIRSERGKRDPKSDNKSGKDRRKGKKNKD